MLLWLFKRVYPFLTYIGVLREDKWCLLLLSAACSVSAALQWVTTQNCLLPFPAVFNVSNEEKASSQGFCLFAGLILRKPFSLNLHLPRENLLIPFICFG